MKATVEKLENSRVALEVEVDSSQVDEALDQAYRKVVREVSLPGFRKGRVPRPILERHYGPAVLHEDALEILFPKVYMEAVEKTEIKPIDEPDVEIIQFGAGQTFRFKAEVPVIPDVELGQYKGLSATRRIVRVTDEDVENQLRTYQEAEAQLVDAERDVVEQDDFVTIDFEGFVDGKPFAGGAANDQQLQIGSGQFIPGFEDQLIGAKLNEETEIEVTFPEHYPQDDLAGQEATFKVTIKAIKVKETPELDDELAKSVSEHDTLEDLRKEVRERLEEEAKERAENNVRNDLLEQLVESSQVEIPQVLIERELERIDQEFRQNLMSQGIDPQLYFTSNNITPEELKEQFEPEAKMRVKTGLVLETLIKSEGITVSSEKIDEHIENMLKNMGEDEDAIQSMRSQFNRPEIRSNIEDSLQSAETIDYLIEHATIDEEIVDAEEAEEEQEQEDKVAAEQAATEDAEEDKEESADREGSDVAQDETE